MKLKVAGPLGESLTKVSVENDRYMSPEVGLATEPLVWPHGRKKTKEEQASMRLWLENSASVSVTMATCLVCFKLMRACHEKLHE